MKGFANKLNKLCTASAKFHNLKREFDEMVVEKYGFHYSDKDLDFIIDSIDYSGMGISYKKFNEIMLKAKNDKTRN